MAKYSRRKRSYKRRPYVNYRWNNYSKAGMQLYRDVRLLKDLINTEKKFVEVTGSAVQLQTNTTGTLVLLNGLTQGTNLTDRVGNSIKMSSIMLEGFLALNSVALYDYVNVSLVLDRQPNGVQPAYTQIYDIGTGPASLGQRSKFTVDRFKVLKSWDIPLSQNGEQMKKFHCYLKLPSGTDSHTKYNNANFGTIADISTNAVYLVFAGNATSNFSFISYFSRIRFVDN